MKWVILGIVIFIIILFFAVSYAIYDIAIVRHNKKSKPKSEEDVKRFNIKEKRKAELSAMEKEDLTLKNPAGLALKAWYIPAAKASNRYAVLVHGHGSNGPEEYCEMIQFYHKKLNFNILLPDLQGHGRSEGKYMCFGTHDYKDILLWVDYLISRFGEGIEMILHGTSMGAATVMLVNENNPPQQVKLIIEDCGYTNAHEIISLTQKDIMKIPIPPAVDFASFICSKTAGYHFKEADCLGQMKNSKLPVLFIHGSEDKFVPTEMGVRLHEACEVDKELLLVENAAHARSYFVNPELYEKNVTSFINSRMGEPILN